MMRLFVALGVPEGLGTRLSILQAGQPGARWVSPDSMHLTLRFIGEVSQDQAEDIDGTLAGVVAPSFDLHLQGVGMFGQGAKTRALWVGVESSDSLAFLQAKVESAVVRAGLPPEGRKFTPHITLARFNYADAHRLQNFVEGNSLFRAGPWTVAHFTLYESRMGKGGSVYIPLANYELRQAY